MKTLLAAAGVCVFFVVSVAAQQSSTSGPDSTGTSKSAGSPATSGGDAVPAPTVLKLRAMPSVSINGTKGDLLLDGQSYPAYGAQLIAHTDAPNIFAKLGKADATSWFSIFDVNQFELMHVGGDRKVGIGTPAPSYQLHLFRNDGLGPTALAIHSCNGCNSSFSVPGASSAAWADAEILADKQAFSLRAYGSAFSSFWHAVSYPGTYPDTGGQIPLANMAEFWADELSSGGNAGLLIGTGYSTPIIPPAPLSPLPPPPIIFATAKTERMRILYTGNVGIGTNTPAALLQVAGDLRLGANGTNTDVRIFTDAPATVNNVSYNQINTITPVTVPASGTSHTLLRLKNATAGGGTNQIDFRVDGTISGGNVIANYQDVAEWVPVLEELTPGTVVVVSDSAKNTVVPSNGAYDTRVAGVVSLSPGLLLGVESSSKAKIATTGRVNVRVDASKGAIHIGDLLVTSDKSGLAMKSEPLDLGGVKIHRPGTLIGKALEPLSNGQGEILVLLSLQ